LPFLFPIYSIFTKAHPQSAHPAPNSTRPAHSPHSPPPSDSGPPSGNVWCLGVRRGGFLPIFHSEKKEEVSQSSHDSAFDEEDGNISRPAS
jgi:hypothetical protein